MPSRRRAVPRVPGMADARIADLEQELRVARDALEAAGDELRSRSSSAAAARCIVGSGSTRDARTSSSRQ